MSRWRTVNTPIEPRMSISGFWRDHQDLRQVPNTVPSGDRRCLDDLENDTIVLTTSTRFRRTRGGGFAVAFGLRAIRLSTRDVVPLNEKKGHRERRAVLISASTRGAMRVRLREFGGRPEEGRRRRSSSR